MFIINLNFFYNLTNIFFCINCIKQRILVWNLLLNIKVRLLLLLFLVKNYFYKLHMSEEYISFPEFAERKVKDSPSKR